MARSFDIARKPKYRPSPAPVAGPPPGRGSRKRSGLIFLIFVIAVIIASLSFTDILKKPLVKPATTTKSSSKTTTSNNKNNASTKTDTITTDTATPSTLKIQVLNGTGIETITEQVKKTLIDNKFPVESTSKAQFEYGQTYIYYRTNAVESAKKISQILSAYKPTLSESQISGLFDILIIIGKQNLPPAQ
ncbi:MAG: LytR C-terminal domain-containing protein [bacterium]|nr:LytR C-terminal domain-containing protein [bacterium]